MLTSAERTYGWRAYASITQYTKYAANPTAATQNMVAPRVCAAIVRRATSKPPMRFGASSQAASVVRTPTTPKVTARVRFPS